MPIFDDDDVEVLYDVPYATGKVNGKGNGNGNGNSNGNGSTKRNRGSQGVRTNGSSRIMNTNVDFENVFDPFERDQDDVREFFDDLSDDKYDEANDDWESPTMFNDPRKVSVRKGN